MLSGVLQEVLLAPIMFLVYVKEVHCCTYFYRWRKLLRTVEYYENCELLQKNLDKISEWSQRLDMEFNAKIYRLMETGKSSRRKTGNYVMDN